MVENINGIQVDVSKYVGEEIAKLAVSTIDNVRLESIAREAIVDVQNDRWIGGERTSIVKNMAVNEVSKVIQTYISDIIETDEFKEQAKQKAVEIINDMQNEVRRIVIEQYANALAGNISTGYFGGMFRMNVEEIMCSMMASR